MTSATVRIAHLSDIHFYESSDGKPHHYRHDIGCLKKIKLLFEQEKPEYLVITGDVTNMGDKLSLERAYQWVHDKIYVDGEYYGLGCSTNGIIPIIVPGNHDAFNAPTHGNNYQRWQSSLENYYAAFPEYRFSDPKNSVDFQWINKGATNLFVCRLDSCYLGDDETEDLPGALSIDRVAKGKLSRSQSEQILQIYDKALRGELRDGSGSVISAGAFMRSLKILVMHHYLFEPSDARAQPLLQMNDKRAVFQNLAMSDFDVLLCGHKHIADVQVFSYLDHFDPRARVRLAFNHVRRSLGISSLPMRSDEEGHLFSRMYRFLLGVLYISKTKGKGLTDTHANEILSVLERGLEHPSVLKEELLKYIRQRNDVLQAGLFEEDEIRDLHSRIQKSFTPDQQRRLLRAATSLRGMVDKLGGRPFAHISSASSAKSSETKSRNRAVSIYDVFNDQSQGEYTVVTNRFSWNASAVAPDGTVGTFSRPVRQKISFPHDRISNLTSDDCAD